MFEVILRGKSSINLTSSNAGRNVNIYSRTNTTEVTKSKAVGQPLKHIARIPRNYHNPDNSKPQEHTKVLGIFKCKFLFLRVITKFYRNLL